MILRCGDSELPSIGFDWDVTHRARSLTDELGWQIDYNVIPAEQAGKRSLIVTVMDRDSKPLGGLRVSAKVYRHARGGEVDKIRCALSRTGITKRIPSCLRRDCGKSS